MDNSNVPLLQLHPGHQLASMARIYFSQFQHLLEHIWRTAFSSGLPRTQRRLTEQAQQRATEMFMGLKHVREEAERAGFGSQQRRRQRGDFLSVFHFICREDGAREGYEAMDTSQNMGKFRFKIIKTFLMKGWSKTQPGCSERWWNLRPWSYLKLNQTRS